MKGVSRKIAEREARMSRKKRKKDGEGDNIRESRVRERKMS